MFFKFYAINQYMQLFNIQLSDTVCIPYCGCILVNLIWVVHSLQCFLGRCSAADAGWGGPSSFPIISRHSSHLIAQFFGFECKIFFGFECKIYVVICEFLNKLFQNLWHLPCRSLDQSEFNVIQIINAATPVTSSIL